MGMKTLIVTDTWMEAQQLRKKLPDGYYAVVVGGAVPSVMFDLIICPTTKIEATFRNFQTSKTTQKVLINSFHEWFDEALSTKLAPNGVLHRI